MKTKIILWLMQTKLYKYLLKYVLPFIRFTTYYTSFKGTKYHVGYNKLEPADILVTVDRKKLTTLLIGGEFSHAAFCVSKDQVFEVAEMTHEDFKKSCFFDICKESDRVVILRCPLWDDEYKRQVIDRCRTLEKSTYDVQFDLGIKSLYCSELIYHSDFMKTLELNLDDLAGLGKPYISPEGVYKCKRLKVVWDSQSDSSLHF